MLLSTTTLLALAIVLTFLPKTGANVVEQISGIVGAYGDDNIQQLVGSSLDNYDREKCKLMIGSGTSIVNNGDGSVAILRSTNSDATDLDEELERSTRAFCRFGEVNDELVEEEIFNDQNELSLNYEVLDFVGRGATAKVYSGKNLHTEQLVAIKVGNYGTKLFGEYRALLQLDSDARFPRVHYFGVINGQHVMVTDLLHTSLNKLTEYNGKSLPLETVLMLTIEMVHIAKTLHDNFLLHLDFKPDNFVFDQNGMLKVVDMGTVKTFVDANGKHLNQPDNEKENEARMEVEGKIIMMDGVANTGPTILTPTFMTVNAHLRKTLGPREDMQTIFLIQIFLLFGLPWDKIYKSSNSFDLTRQILEDKFPYFKDAEGVKRLCGGFEEKFGLHVMFLKFDDKPDYDYLQEILHAEIQRRHFPYDGKYCWTDKTEILRNNHMTKFAVDIVQTKHDPKPDLTTAIIIFFAYYTDIFRNINRLEERQNVQLRINPALMDRSVEPFTTSDQEPIENTQKIITENSVILIITIDTTAVAPKKVQNLLDEEYFQAIYTKGTKHNIVDEVQNTEYLEVGFTWLYSKNNISTAAIILTKVSILSSANIGRVFQLRIDQDLVKTANNLINSEKHAPIDTLERSKYNYFDISVDEVFIFEVEHAQYKKTQLCPTTIMLDALKTFEQLFSGKIKEPKYTRFGPTFHYNPTTRKSLVIFPFKLYICKAWNYIRTRCGRRSLTLQQLVLPSSIKEGFEKEKDFIGKDLEETAYTLALDQSHIMLKKDDNMKDEEVHYVNFVLTKNSVKLIFANNSASRAEIATLNKMRKTQPEGKWKLSVEVDTPRSMIAAAYEISARLAAHPYSTLPPALNSQHRFHHLIDLPPTVNGTTPNLVKLGFEKVVTIPKEIKMLIEEDIVDTAFGAPTIINPNQASFSTVFSLAHDFGLGIVNNLRRRAGLKEILGRTINISDDNTSRAGAQYIKYTACGPVKFFRASKMNEAFAQFVQDVVYHKENYSKLVDPDLIEVTFQADFSNLPLPTTEEWKNPPEYSFWRIRLQFSSTGSNSPTNQPTALLSEHVEFQTSFPASTVPAENKPSATSENPLINSEVCSGSSSSSVKPTPVDEEDISLIQPSPESAEPRVSPGQRETTRQHETNNGQPEILNDTRIRTTEKEASGCCGIKWRSPRAWLSDYLQARQRKKELRKAEKKRK